MMINYWNIVAFLFTCLAALPVAREALSDESDRRPNIVILFADDLGYGELGCQGNPEIPTPHIDSIAEHGVRMTSGYVTASYCSASRAGLMTGRYQMRFGYEFNPIGRTMTIRQWDFLRRKRRLPSICSKPDTRPR